MTIWVAQYKDESYSDDFILGYWSKEPTKKQIVELLYKEYPFDEYEINFDDIDYDVYPLECLDTTE